MDPDEALARALQEEEDRTTAAALLAAEARDADGGGAVSYTHLTLPTILLV